MSVYCVWGEIENVIVLHVEGDWTWDDYYTAEAELFRMIEDYGQPVINIGVMIHSNGLPPRLIQHAMTIFDRYNPLIETTIIVGTNSALRLALNTVKRLFPLNHPIQRFNMVDTLEKAYDMARSYNEINDRSR